MPISARARGISHGFLPKARLSPFCPPFSYISYTKKTRSPEKGLWRIGEFLMQLRCECATSCNTSLEEDVLDVDVHLRDRV